MPLIFVVNTGLFVKILVEETMGAMYQNAQFSASCSFGGFLKNCPPFPRSPPISRILLRHLLQILLLVTGVEALSLMMELFFLDVAPRRQESCQLSTLLAVAAFAKGF